MCVGQVERHVDPRHVWERYRRNEATHHGGFKLLYPLIEAEVRDIRGSRQRERDGDTTQTCVSMQPPPGHVCHLTFTFTSLVCVPVVQDLDRVAAEVESAKQHEVDEWASGHESPSLSSPSPARAMSGAPDDALTRLLGTQLANQQRMDDRHRLNSDSSLNSNGRGARDEKATELRRRLVRPPTEAT